MCRFILAGLFATMFDFQEDGLERDASSFSTSPGPVSQVSKHVFDSSFALLLLLPLSLIALALLALNPLLNRGPLMHYQMRMGRAGRPFVALKFRTMVPSAMPTRGAFDALEEDRISQLGRLMRKLRIDELPQVINVLRAEMSLIGPRPDLYDHARVYLQSVPGYAARYQIMPGISGYAQTEVGYVDGIEGIERKVAADLYYIAHASLRFDLWITWRTLCVVIGRKGR